MTSFLGRWSLLALLTLSVGVISGISVWLSLRASTTTNQEAPGQQAGPLSLAPNELRTKLVETIRNETLMTLIENLPNFDDNVYTMASLSGDEGPGMYEHARLFFPRLNRVKKILEDARQKPGKVHKVLKDKLVESTKKFPKAYRADLAKGSALYSEPSDGDRCIAYGGSCTYLLAELRSYDSLPIMAHIFGRKAPVPVNRVFLFYAMHQLAINHPKENLPRDALQALAAYAKRAAHFPAPQTVKVPTATAAFDEWDFRHTILRQDLRLDKLPLIEMRIYPELPMIKTDLPHFLPETFPELQEPFEFLHKFVAAAYPAKPSPKK